ncbi:chemotaxis protein CheC [Allobacillus sp. GCM10007491]|uniref:Chemotaxis protein CheC n=1 Tax=Allobacillus saliphilus TaxID=2912308 RepID=A0A941HRS3_9BACI|nr:chemotaxis protein CheC [Allobacillus saliphilus]MBR7552911.1 chemotaxis protein CheC [Allobacillus saliphilus]
MNHPFDYTALHKDVLKEIANIGAGNAATSLSEMVNQPIHMKTPVVHIVSFDEMMEKAGGKEEVQAAIHVELQGRLKGSMFFVVDPVEADEFVGLLTGDQHLSLLDGDSLATSAFMELGNILTGSYVRALSDFTNLEIHQSVPSLAIDMLGAMLTVGLIEISQVSDDAIMIETIFNDETSEKKPLQGHFILLPDPDAFQQIFEALGVEGHE